MVEVAGEELVRLRKVEGVEGVEEVEEIIQKKTCLCINLLGVFAWFLFFRCCWGLALCSKKLVRLQMLC